MANFRKKSTIKKPNIFDEIKVVKEEGQIDSLEEIDEELEEPLPHLDFDPDDRDYDSIRLDPISTFTLSESEDEEKAAEREEPEDFTVVSLKPNVDVEVHTTPPTDEERRMKVIWAKQRADKQVKKAAGLLSQDTVEGIRNYFQMLDCIDSQAVRSSSSSVLTSGSGQRGKSNQANEYPPLILGVSHHDSEFISLPSNFVVSDEVLSAYTEEEQAIGVGSGGGQPGKSQVSQDTVDGIRNYFLMLGSIDESAVQLPTTILVPNPKGPNLKKTSENNTTIPQAAATSDKQLSNVKPLLPPIVEEDCQVKAGDADSINYGSHYSPIERPVEKTSVISNSDLGNLSKKMKVPNSLVVVREHVKYVNQNKCQIDVLKNKMSIVNTVQGGRYTLVDRNFTPLPANSDKADVKIYRNADDAADVPLSEQDQVDTSQQQNGPPDSSSDDDSTDTLLEEAKQYVELASCKLVTLEDWEVIESNSRKKKISAAHQTTIM